MNQRRQARLGRRLAAATLALLATTVVAWLLPVPAAEAAQEASTVPAESEPPTQPPTSSDLADRKVEAEIRKLEMEGDQLDAQIDAEQGTWAGLLRLAPFITAVVGIATLAAAIYKQSNDLAAQAQAARTASDQWREDFTQQQRTHAEQAQQWRAELRQQQQEANKQADQWRQDFRHQQTESQRAAEQAQLKRFDERLAEAATNLSSSQRELRLSGAALLGVFISRRSKDLQANMLGLLIAQLRAEQDKAVAKILRGHLSRCLSVIADHRTTWEDLGNRLDLTELALGRLDIAYVELPDEVDVDIAFATLEDANLSDTRLFRLRGFGAELDGARFSRANLEEARLNEVTARRKPVTFHRTRLVSATLKEATIPAARFQQALLQGAHLERADLTGARFEDANLADAYFSGATFDELALRSIATGARYWRKARFDADVFRRLEELSKSSTSR